MKRTYFGNGQLISRDGPGIPFGQEPFYKQAVRLLASDSADNAYEAKRIFWQLDFYKDSYSLEQQASKKSEELQERDYQLGLELLERGEYEKLEALINARRYQDVRISKLRSELDCVRALEAETTFVDELTVDETDPATTPYTVPVDATRWRAFWAQRRTPMSSVGRIVGLPSHWAMAVGKKGAVSSPALEKIAVELGEDPDDTIWEITTDENRERLARMR